MVKQPDTDAAVRWADVWKSAWESRDTEAIVDLYHPDVIFSTQPFRTPYLGLPGVREYVNQAFAAEGAVRVWIGRPVVEGDRASIEWWAALTENGVETTLAGTSVLRFDADGLVVEQRDTWNRADGRREPPNGWEAKRDTRAVAILASPVWCGGYSLAGVNPQVRAGYPRRSCKDVGNSAPTGGEVACPISRGA